MCDILLIDDDVSFSRHFAEYVAERYPRISLNSCANPLEALPLLKTSRYDLVLVDFEMPVLDGRKLVHFALQAGVAPKQIVLLSGHEADLLHEICPAGVCLAVLNKFEERQREVLDMILASLSSKAGKDTPDVC